MACKDLNVEIDGKVIFIREWNATKSLEMLNKAMHSLGGGFAPFVEGDWNFSHVLRLIAGGDQPVQLIKEFVCAARIDGQEISTPLFDSKYNGELMLIMKIFAIVCEVNYKDFFEQGQKLNNAREAESREKQAQQKMKSTTL